MSTSRPSTSSSDPITDAERLAALDDYQILDSPLDDDFDHVVRLATSVCEAPIALVTLVARDRQWFKARIGISLEQTELDRSVCAHALSEPDLLVIPDLTADPRTRDNPVVTGEPYFRFYAGAPLRDPGGHVLGTLCVVDKVPRPGGLTEHQAEVLRALAQQVMMLMELRRSVSHRDRILARRREAEHRLSEAHVRLQLSEAHWRGLFERLNEGLLIGEVVRDAAGRAADWRYLDVNSAWGKLTGVEPASVIGQTVRDVFPGIEEEWVEEFNRVAETGESASFIRRIALLERWYEGRAFPLDEGRFAVLFSEVTERIRMEIRRNALLEIGDELRDLTTPEEMTAKASAIVGQALDVTRVGFGWLDREGEHVVIGPDWTASDMPSIAGRHRFADYGDIRQELLLGEPLVVRDVLTDPRTVNDLHRWEQARVRALVYVPIQERGRTVAIFLIQDAKPRDWAMEIVSFVRNVADRLTAGVARLKAESDQQVLNQELSHRMKNMLTMIQAIAMQTLKGVTEQDAVTGFQSRLMAMSEAHDVLLQTSWTSAPLREVVGAVLGRLGSAEQFSFDGPGVTLGPRATLSVSLLLHELATNAAKHGALSVEGGRVAVSWTVDLATGELVFTWRETGGPPTSEPTRKGFGSRLIRSGLLGTGGATVRYLSTGLHAEMRASLEQVQVS